MLNKVFLALIASSPIAMVGAEPWKGNADLGWLSNSGNSESTSINGQVEIGNETEDWEHKVKLAAAGATSEDANGNDISSAEKYSVELKSDRKLDERSYLYAVADYTDDRFSGYEFQGNVGLGYGYKVIAEDNMTLALEIGPGYSHSLISPDNRTAGQSSHIEEFTYRIGESFTWNFSETSELSQYITYNGGSDLSTLKYGGFVLSKLSGALSLKVGVDITTRGGDAQDRAEDQDPTLDDTDTTTYANLSYSF